MIKPESPARRLLECSQLETEVDQHQGRGEKGSRGEMKITALVERVSEGTENWRGAKAGLWGFGCEAVACQPGEDP